MTPDDFFARYAAALLARDADAMAALYAVPSLILFPGNAIAVDSAEQTRAFFDSAWAQYDGIDAVAHTLTVMAEAPGTVWCDVTWSYGGAARERFCYQLVVGAHGLQIAVLTPMTL